MIILYDLCGAESSLRFGPFCWTAKFALLHKGLPFETVPLGFAEKPNYPDPDYGKLPMITDRGEIVRDSAAIADYLDRAYPARSLAATDAERAASHFYRAWAAAALFPALRPFLIGRVLRALRAEDRDYFRTTRERALGETIEAVEARADRKALETAIAPLAAPLAAYPFLGGAHPNLSDYVASAPLFWAWTIRSDAFFSPPAAVAAWFERLLDLHDGYARAQTRAA